MKTILPVLPEARGYLRCFSAGSPCLWYNHVPEGGKAFLSGSFMRKNIAEERDMF